MMSSASTPELPDHLLTLQAPRDTTPLPHNACVIETRRFSRMQEELASGEAQLFDVREPQETAAGRLRAAFCVPLSELREGKLPADLDASKARALSHFMAAHSLALNRRTHPAQLTYLHCAAGVRVHAAAPILESMGFKRVVPLQEGFGLLVHLGVDEAV